MATPPLCKERKPCCKPDYILTHGQSLFSNNDYFQNNACTYSYNRLHYDYTTTEGDRMTREHAAEAKATTWEDFDHCTVAEFNDNYWGWDNPLVADDDATVWFTTIGAPFDGGYVATVLEDEGEYFCELTGMGWTGVAQSDGHPEPWEAWEDSKELFIRECEAAA